MIRALIHRQLDSQERKLGASLDYLRDVLRVSLPAFLKFGLFVPLSEHRKALAPEAAAVARIVAVRAEDCGTCVQIAVNQARAARVASELLRLVLERRPSELPEPLGDVYAFAALVARADAPELEVERGAKTRDARSSERDAERGRISDEAKMADERELRERLRARLGERAFTELALAIASVRVFPTVKRALGHAVGCDHVAIRID